METTKKILVVDDDLDVQNIIRTILENENYEVMIAGGKKEALEMMAIHKPDLAILDVMMESKFEGFELAKTIRENSETKQLPILFQTSIYVLDTTDNDIIKYTHELRKSLKDDELRALLIQNTTKGIAGIDYYDESSNNVWIPIQGFITKPIE